MKKKETHRLGVLKKETHSLGKLRKETPRGSAEILSRSADTPSGSTPSAGLLAEEALAAVPPAILNAKADPDTLADEAVKTVPHETVTKPGPVHQINSKEIKRSIWKLSGIQSGRERHTRLKTLTIIPLVNIQFN